MASDSTPFLDASKKDQHLKDEHLSVDERLELHDAVSDGLTFRRGSSWFWGSYTRPDCRCGSCPASDPEPCPYALPPHSQALRGGSAGSLLSRAGSMLTSGGRSMSKMLSFRETKHS